MDKFPAEYWIVWNLSGISISGIVGLVATIDGKGLLIAGALSTLLMVLTWIGSLVLLEDLK